MDSKEIKIRPLVRRDRKTVAAIFRKLAEKLGAHGILDIVSSAPSASATTEEKPDDKDRIAVFGIELLKQALDILEDDVAKWFADLVGVTPEQFDDLPVDVELIILEQLVNAEEVNGFFSRALQLFKTMRRFVPSLSTGKTA